MNRALSVLRDGARQWSADRNASMAAALAFYSAFSLAPMLVLVIAVAGAFFGVEAVQGRLYKEIAGLVGADGAAVIQTMVANAWKADRGGVTALASIGALLVGASASFTQLHVALNRVWTLPPATRTGGFLRGVMDTLRVRATSVGLVLGIAFLLLVLLVVDAAMSFVVTWIWGGEDAAYWFMKTAQWLTSWLLMTLAFAALMHLLSDARPPWHDVFIGAATGALLFSAGKRLFGLYLARAGTADAFGAAGSLAVVLMWLYYSSAVFLFGAQVSAACTRQRTPPVAGARPEGV